VSLVSFVGTLALGVAMLQTDAALITLRRAATAAARTRARVAATSFGVAMAGGGAGSLALPGVTVHAGPARVRATTTVRGRTLELAIER
jgi:hypothetical protein